MVTTITNGMSGLNARNAINNNFGEKISGTLDTDVTLATNSDVRIPSQKAVKAYVDANTGAVAIGDVTGLGSGVATFLGAPSSANLAAAVTDESGTGALLFAGGALGTPASGLASNLTGLPLTTGVTGILGAANGGTGISNSKTLTISNNLTLAGTDSTVMTFPSTSATIARTDAANTFTGAQTFSTPIATASVATMSATVGGGVPTPPNDATKFLNGQGAFTTPAGGGGLTIGTTTITSGTTTRLLYDAAGVVGESTVTTDGTNLTITSGSLTWTGNGYIDTTGPSTFRFRANTTSNFFALTSAAPNVLTLGSFASATPVAQTLTIGEASRGGTDTNVAGATGTIQSGAGTGSGAGSSLIIKTPTTGSTGTTAQSYATRLTINDTAFTVVPPMAAASLALGGATIGANDLALTGSTVLGAGSVGTPSIRFGADGAGFYRNASNQWAFTSDNATPMMSWFTAADFPRMRMSATMGLVWTESDGTGTDDLYLRRLAPANIQVGAKASGSPIAQIMTLGEVSRAGTDSNVAGANGTLQSGLGTGNATASKLIFQTPVVGSSGTTAQTYGTALTLNNSTATGIQFNGYGAGALSADASGNVTATSALAAKTDLRSFDYGLETVLKIAPQWWKWRKETNLDTKNEYGGFIADEIAKLIPELNGHGDPSRLIIAACVNAIKELHAKLNR